MTPGAPRASPSRLTVVGVAGAAALVPLNSTMIAVALPRIADDFDASAGRVSVLVTVYLVAMLLGQPLAGRISDAFGNRRTVEAALVGFALCSLAGAAAGSFAALVLARGGQAVFASALGPSVQSMLRSVSSSPERGRMFGILGSVQGAGAASGPVVGGALTQLYGWRAIFVANLPVVAAALAASARVRPAVASEVAPAATSTTEASPILNRVFVASFWTQALSTQAQYALLLLAPLVLDARGWGSGSVGLALSALTVGMIVAGPAGGRAGDRHGRRMPVLRGLAVAAAATTVAAAGGPGIDPALLMAALGAFGFGLGFATPSVTTAALESVREGRTGSAAGVLSASRYVGSIATSLAVSAFVAADAGGSRIVLGIATVSTVVAWAVARWLPGRLEGPASAGAGSPAALEGDRAAPGARPA